MKRPKFTVANGQCCHDSEYVRRGVAELFVAVARLARTLRQGRPPRRHVRGCTSWPGSWTRPTAPPKKDAGCRTTSPRTKSAFSTTISPRSGPGVPAANGNHLPPRSWLNRTEIEFTVLSHQTLNRAFANKAAVQVAATCWKDQQNAKPKPRNWQFKTADTRIKLTKLYPTI